MFDRYHGVIWRYLARAAGPQAADDLTGEVFVSAFASRHRFDPALGRVQSWLYGIAANTLRMSYRSASRDRRAVRRLAALRPQDDSGPSLVEDAEALSGRARQAQHALRELPHDEWEVLVLNVWEQLSYAEIADALQIPVGTVRSRLARARSRIRSAEPDHADRQPRSNDHERHRADEHR